MACRSAATQTSWEKATWKADQCLELFRAHTHPLPGDNGPQYWGHSAFPQNKIIHSVKSKTCKVLEMVSVQSQRTCRCKGLTFINSEILHLKTLDSWDIIDILEKKISKAQEDGFREKICFHS